MIISLSIVLHFTGIFASDYITYYVHNQKYKQLY